ncbi:MAG: winged helix-turn-helix domain-containing protein [Bdellovibrionota bacterium]
MAKKTKPSSSKSRNSCKSLLQLAKLRWEKCELAEAYFAFEMALDQARKSRDRKAAMEAISGLLRLSAEATDEEGASRWERELDRAMHGFPKQIPPMAWYCKGAIARHHDQTKLAQLYFHRYLRAVREEGDEESTVRGWVMMAVALHERGLTRRADALAHVLLRKYEVANYRGMNGMLYLVLGNIAEAARQLETAMTWYQKAHAAFLSEHHWYNHLYVLCGYARIHRMKQSYSQAYWYLDLVDKAANGPEFGLLKSIVVKERKLLELDAVDLLIDSKKGVVKTRESGQISLRKQYVLLHILEALTNAHESGGPGGERGLSKAEIIENVWKVPYHARKHDNKLYYNINRLRKLIEPDIKKPQYLLNWKEGYRLAPGLRVQFVGPKINLT